MEQPIALDLCCGKGGWGQGLKKAGWKVIGFDIEAWPNEFNDIFVLVDIRKVKGRSLTRKFGKISLVCASPPCQEFSYSSFPFKKAREKFTAENPPDRSIWDACVRIAAECKAPLILENVRGAQKWMGKAVTHYGSFYLWGDLPPMLPIGNPKKGFTRAKDLKNPSDSHGGFGGNAYHTKGKEKFGWNRDEVQLKRKGEFNRGESQSTSSKSSARKEWSAKIAMIPPELSEWIGMVFHPQGI